MKATNKIISLIILMVLSVSALFAADSMLPQDDVTYNLVTNRFTKTSARILSMGGAGIAVRIDAAGRPPIGGAVGAGGQGGNIDGIGNLVAGGFHRRQRQQTGEEKMEYLCHSKKYIIYLELLDD